MVQIIAGFSLINRWLLYTSMMLAPAQFISGVGSNCPSNLGFLAYNWYTQVFWYRAIKGRQLHALSLLPVHFNTLFSMSYLGGITSGNIWMGLPLGIGSAGVIILNLVSSWTSWATNQPEGFGVYQFFFFGWRTLSPGWHKFILLWQIGDTMEALICILCAITVSIQMSLRDEDDDPEWWARYAAIIPGAAFMLIIGWPLILWTELIVARNQIESDTDMIAVYLFIGQVAAMLIPGCSFYLGCFRGTQDRIETIALSKTPSESRK
jgi:hypothetical protein